MADSYVQTPADGSGKKLQTKLNTIGANNVHAECIHVVDASGATQSLAKETGGNLASVATDASTIAGDTTSIDGKITACNTGNVTIGAALPAGTNTIGKVGVHEGITYDHAHFDAAADGNLVAGIATKVIKVHGLTIQAQGTVVVNLRDDNGGNSIAEWSFQAREGVVYAFAPYPAHWFQSAVGKPLYVDLSAAITVTINCIYSDEDAS